MQTSPLSILIVEDDAAARGALYSLIALGYPEIAIRVADNGQSGLAAFRQQPADMVIADLNMPVMDGIEMSAQIKAQAPGVAVVALTAHTDAQFLLRSIEVGIDFYLLKPLVCERLFAVIDEVSQRREMRAAWLAGTGSQTATDHGAVEENVTQLKLAEELLSQSEERSRELFDHSNDAIFILSAADYSILDCNGEAEKVFGYGRQELLGTEIFTLLVDAGRSFMEPVGESAAGQWQIERMSMLKKDGSRLLVSCKFKLITLNADRVFYCSFRDITDRIQTEDEALAVQANLIQADKMASLGLLVSGIAHEINNPNNCILFNSELLAKTWNSTVPILEEFYRDNGDFKLGSFKYSETRDIIPRLFSGLVDGAERVRSIVNMLKDFARQDRGDTLSSFDLNKVITDAIAIVNHEIKKRCRYFYLETGELPPALGNAQQIEQVLINLIMNSLQSLGDPSRAIRINTRLSEDGTHIAITVTDEGEGMSAEVLQHLTDPFFTTRGESGGTGLGLSISSAILRKNRGAISFSSEPGRGTTALVKLSVFPSQP